MTESVTAMPLIEHLRELRRRLLISIGALVFGMLAAIPITAEAIARLEAMCPNCQLQALHPTETFVTYFRVALALGLVVATPIILYQIVAFVSPGLHKSERRLLLVMLPGAGLMFALGLMFGFFVAVPRAIAFLSGFMGYLVEQGWSISAYVAFVTNLLILIGVTFETPLVVFGLAKLGIVTPAFLSHYRRHAIVVMAVLAAVMTPTPDFLTMMLVLIPMIVLYEIGVLLARIAVRTKSPT